MKGELGHCPKRPRGLFKGESWEPRNRAFTRGRGVEGEHHGRLSHT